MIFQNAANLQLRGNTYDAFHLDKFLNSGYGEKSLNHNTIANYKQQQSKLMEPSIASSTLSQDYSTRLNQSSVVAKSPQNSTTGSAGAIKVKPSVSFMTLSREQIKMNHFVDLDDGPIPVQAREKGHTLREARKESFFYDTER